MKYSLKIKIMKSTNNTTKFYVKLYHSARNGEPIYKMVEFRDNQIVKAFEAEKIKSCLDHFGLPSDDEYLIYWMFNCEEVEMPEEEAVFSKN